MSNVTFLFLLFIILFYAVSSVSYEYILKEDVMYIIIGEEIFPISLNESPITKEFISILPLKIRQIQKDSTKIKMPLSFNIETTSFYSSINNLTEANKGDIILYKGKEVIIFKEPTNLSKENGNFFLLGTWYDDNFRICKNYEGISEFRNVPGTITRVTVTTGDSWASFSTSWRSCRMPD